MEETGKARNPKPQNPAPTLSLLPPVPSFFLLFEVSSSRQTPKYHCCPISLTMILEFALILQLSVAPLALGQVGGEEATWHYSSCVDMASVAYDFDGSHLNVLTPKTCQDICYLYHFAAVSSRYVIHSSCRPAKRLCRSCLCTALRNRPRLSAGQRLDSS